MPMFLIDIGCEKSTKQLVPQTLTLLPLSAPIKVILSIFLPYKASVYFLQNYDWPPNL